MASRAGEITLGFGPDEYKFRLGIGQMRELQEACNAGPMFIGKRLRDGTWLIEDIRETIRLGLIGGGMEPNEARAMVMKHVDQYPWASHIMTAWFILQAAIVGITEEDVGKVLEEELKARSDSHETKSPSKPSTAAVQ